MRMTIRVGNLDLSTTESDLEELCSPFGRVRRVRLVANIQEASGVIGIVEMRSEQECHAALAALGGQNYRGRVLTVFRGIGRRAANVHPGMSGPASVTREQKLGSSCGPTPGGFGDRSGKGSTGGQFFI
ncbi:MAG TPA: RNA-binding protein [Tepidisphaeraceae bacterium]|jgi:RNA recognition motif-containing protein|nr:RNA-binding protein [Tepidisphaeraceae bacterium]